MQFEKEPITISGVFYLPLPIDLVRYFGITEKTTFVIQDEDGKHGKYQFLDKRRKEKVKTGGDSIRVRPTKSLKPASHS